MAVGWGGGEESKKEEEQTKEKRAYDCFLLLITKEKNSYKKMD